MRSVLGFVVGVVLSFALTISVELFSEAVYPAPVAAKESMEAMCTHVANYPHWILGVVVGMWSLIGWLGTWVATRIGNWISGGALALLLNAGLFMNLTMLPYVAWFEILMPICFILACVAGIRMGARRMPIVAQQDATPPNALSS